MTRKEASDLASEIYHFLADRERIAPEDVDYILRSLSKLRPTVFGWSPEIDSAIGRVRKLRSGRGKGFELDREDAIYSLAGIAAQAANFE